MMSAAEWRVSNIAIRERMNMTDVKSQIIDLTEKFYTLQTEGIDLLENVGKYTKANALFLIKYRLPNQLLL